MRNSRHILIALFAVAACSSCCEQQFNHSVRRVWCDYNSFREPALSFTQFDHLPYPAAQVGYYRWMYDKDPGHQLAALGPVPQPICVVPQCVPAGDNPFEYQVAFPNAIPNQTDSLWGDNLPEPINTLHSPLPDGANSNGLNGKVSPPSMLTVPMAPVLPPSTGDKPTDSTRPPGNSSRSAQPSGGLPGSTMPGFESSPPPPRPVDEDVPPMLGPASQADPNLRLTTGAPASRQAPPVNAVWPR